MGKKKPEEMAAQREKFLKGSLIKKINEKKSEKVFNLMEKFAGYGFNKSHSAAYAQVSYQTAYLKAHFPLEFFGALITSDMDNTDKVLRYIHDCREMKITVQPPDVNLSQRDFSVCEDILVFGLGAIKNVGSKAIDNIIEARQELSRFTSLEQLCENVDMQLANKRVFESLIKSGACDSLGQGRAQMMSELQARMEQGQSKQRDKALGQSSMFDSFKEDVSESKPSAETVEEWNDADRLRLEKESIGFYITGHPLDEFTRELAWFTDATSASIAESGNKKKVSLAGIPIKHLPKTTRKGDKMGIITLEDLHGSVEVILWPEIYSGAQELLLDEVPLLVKGEVDAEGSMPKVIASEVFPLAQANQHFQGKVMIHFRTLGLERETLMAVKEILASHKGNIDTRLHFIFPDNKERVVKVAEELRIKPSDELLGQIESLLGEDAILFE
jgi:DNA polymerase-3 subunit alpha